jgi:hypothetical protein
MESAYFANLNYDTIQMLLSIVSLYSIQILSWLCIGDSLVEPSCTSSSKGHQ